MSISKRLDGRRRKGTFFVPGTKIKSFILHADGTYSITYTCQNGSEDWSITKKKLTEKLSDSNGELFA